MTNLTQIEREVLLDHFMIHSAQVSAFMVRQPGGNGTPPAAACIIRSKIQANRASVGPYMNQAVLVTCIDFIAFFVIEKSSYVFQSLCNCASNHAGAASSPPLSLLDLGAAIASIYFSQAFPCQNITDIDRTSCINNERVRE